MYESLIVSPYLQPKILSTIELVTKYTTDLTGSVGNKPMNPNDKINHDDEASISANLSCLLGDVLDKIIWKI
jgi:hypothetical protein